MSNNNNINVDYTCLPLKVNQEIRDRRSRNLKPIERDTESIITESTEEEEMDSTIITPALMKFPEQPLGYQPRRNKIAAFVNNYRLPILVDSGADVSVMSKTLYEELGSPTLETSVKRLRSAGGSKLTAKGILRVTMRFKGTGGRRKIRKVPFIVVPELGHKIILGMDFMEKYGVSISWDKLQKGKAKLYLKGAGLCDLEGDIEAEELSMPVITKRHDIINANSTMLVNVKVVGAEVMSEGIIEPVAHLPSGIMVPRSLITVRPHGAVIQITNTSDKTVVLDEDKVIGIYTNWNLHRESRSDHENIFHTPSYTTKDSDDTDSRKELGEINNLNRLPAAQEFERWISEGCPEDDKESDASYQSDGEGRELETELREKMNPDLTEEQKNKLMKVLLRRRGAFPNKSGPLNCCRLFENVIKIPVGQKPINQRQYPLQKEGEAAIEEEIETLITKGVIVECESEWNCPILLVKKPSGAWRTVIDFRSLNKVIEQISVPIPKINEALNALGGNAYFTGMDLPDGFFQLGLAPPSIPLTCFRYKGISYCHQRMPQGCKSSPASFQLAMQLVLRGLQWKMCLVYLDDVLVYTPKGPNAFDNHLKDIDEVLHRLEKANLTVKPSKCEWAQTELIFLGHKIDVNGVRPTKENLLKIKARARPTKLKELRGFLGALGQYRRFVPKFSFWARPLYDLLRKDVPYLWTEAHQQSFDKLQNYLTEDDTLGFPDYNHPFILTVGVDEEVGCFVKLSQRKGKDKEVVVCNASKNWNKWEKKHPIVEQSAAALLFATEKFKLELTLQEFEVRTSCKELNWLLTSRTLTGRAAKWGILLASYRFSIKVTVDSYLEKCDVKDRDGPELATIRGEVFGKGGVLILTFDGGCRRKTHKSAHSWVLWTTNFQPIACGAQPTTGHTNNDQEFMGVYAGIVAAMQYRPEDLLIMGDSKLVLEMINGSMTPQSNILNMYTKVTQDLLGQLPGEFKTQHIPRERNDAADFLCNQAMDTGKEIEINQYWCSEIQKRNNLKEFYEKAKRIAKEADSERITDETKLKESCIMAMKAARKTTGKGPVEYFPIMIENEEVTRRLIKGQDSTPWMKNLKRFLTTGDLPSDKSVSDQVVRNAEDFVVKDGLLYHLWYDVPNGRKTQGFRVRHEPKWQLVVATSERAAILNHYHGEYWAGHHGITKTYRAIRLRYFWHAMMQDVIEYCRRCESCQTGKLTKKRQAELQRNIIPQKPLDAWGIDVQGPFKKSRRGNQFLIVFVDLYSRWTEAIPSPDHKAETVVRLLIDEIFARFGVPRIILTDRGSEFLSRFCRILYKMTNVKKLTTTAYHPQTNGMVERMNQTISAKLRMYVDADQLDWDVYIPRVLWGIRADMNEATNHSPFEILFGEQMHLPPDRTMDVLKDAMSVRRMPLTHQQYLGRLKSDLCDIRTKALEAMDKRFKRNKRNYDAKVRPVSFEKGEQVWLYLEALAKDVTKKLAHKWHGPFIVIKQEGTSCTLILEKGQKIHPVVHVNRLRKFYSEEWVPNNSLREEELGGTLELTAEELPASSFVEDEEENLLLEDEFEVEKIMDVRQQKVKKGQRPGKEYRVRWKGYSAKDDTWEAYLDLNCERLVEEFERERKNRLSLKNVLELESSRRKEEQ